MKRQPLFSFPFAPFLLWVDLAGKSFEMMCASAQVIAHRTSRMALAGHSPSARDRQEFALMGQEKLEAGTKSAQAMAVEMLTMGPSWGTAACRDWLRSYSALASLAHSQSASQMIARQAALAQALGQSALGMADATASASRLAHRGLKPIHARAVANAKRLGRN